MWTRADASGAEPERDTKFFALQVLDAVIKYRWNALPMSSARASELISNLIIKLGTDEASSAATARSSTRSTTCWWILKNDWPGGRARARPRRGGEAERALCETR